MLTGAAIASICGLLLALLQLWSAKAPERLQEDVDEAIQKGRKDIADGNADAVSIRIDSLLPIQADPPGNLAGEHNTGELLKQFCRDEDIELLPDRASGTGEATGTSGELPTSTIKTVGGYEFPK